MDWAAIATVLAERGRPVVIVDRAGRVRMVNASMEHLLGRGRFELEGQRFEALFAASDRRDETKRYITDALRGTVTNSEVMAMTREGPLWLTLDMRVTGAGHNQAVIATVMRSRTNGQGALVPRDASYEVSTSAESFGLLIRLTAEGRQIPVGGEHDREVCFASLYGRTEACPDCPVLLHGRPWPRLAIRHRRMAKETGEETLYELVTAEAGEGASVRIRLRTIDEATLGAIRAERIRISSDAAGLSAREREVLTYLLMGRTIEDIADLIGIASRTVKHHQANVLRKLGADSRADLTRLFC